MWVCLCDMFLVAELPLPLGNPQTWTWGWLAIPRCGQPLESRSLSSEVKGGMDLESDLALTPGGGPLHGGRSKAHCQGRGGQLALCSLC